MVCSDSPGDVERKRYIQCIAEFASHRNFGASMITECYIIGSVSSIPFDPCFEPRMIVASPSSLSLGMLGAGSHPNVDRVLDCTLQEIVES